MNRLGTWRKAKGWSQAYLGAQLGCSQDQISKYEKDFDDPKRKVPSPTELMLLFEISGGQLDPNYFHGIALQPVVEQRSPAKGAGGTVDASAPPADGAAA